MIKAGEKTVIYWVCPNCNKYNEIEERDDKPLPNELECIHCGYDEEWEES
jgi:hypothetical protein